MKKVVAITGTNSGLGLATSLRLAEQGYEVYATMRNLEKKSGLLERAEEAGVRVHVLRLDVADRASIDQAVDTILEREGRIDVFINNAGAGFAKNIEQASEREIQWVTDVNYIGVVRCCQAVIPHMRRQNRGHIVNVTSVGGLVGQPFNELYCAAKFAVEGFTEALATVLPQHFGIHLSLVEPGGIASEFATSAAHATLGDGLPEDAYTPIFQKYLAGFQERGDEKSQESAYQTPEEVAEVVLQIIEDEDPPLRRRTSPWAEEICGFKTSPDPDGRRQREDVIARFL